MWRGAFWLLLGYSFLPLGAEQVHITVLATTDLHGNILPVDYYAGQTANRGLAKIATLIEAARASNPNHLLIDCGDTIQGSPLEYVYQSYVRTGRLPLSLNFAGSPLDTDPMMVVMNHLGYDAMTVGNHEYNFGLKNLDRARASARFPWLSANTEIGPGSPYKPFQGYLLKTVGGVKVAVIGVTTPTIPSWEKPENIAKFHFLTARQGVEKAMAALKKEHPDLVIVAAHAGLGRNPRTGQADTEAIPGENAMYDVAESVSGVDAIILGHTHTEIAQHFLNGVLLMQPRNWGISLGEMDFTLEREPGARWRVKEKSSKVIPVTSATAVDETVVRLAQPYHELAERYLNTEVARSDADLDSSLGRVEDTVAVDAVQEVQLHYTGADVSFASLFNPRVKLPKGPVTVRQIAGLYLYDNELYEIEGNGKMVKDALENAARFYLQCSGEACTHPPLINSRVIGYNYDMAQGVTYQIDLTRPEGDRIRNLMWKGKPLDPGQKLRIALNNYRAGGSAGYSMFRNAKIVWKSGEDIRQLMIDYYTKVGRLLVAPDGNWRIVPPEAQQTLVREAQGFTRGNLQ
jgi:2',3'-cyclic-nucleotide 2'-phosphodiesterase / 3'-nucleotidase